MTNPVTMYRRVSVVLACIAVSLGVASAIHLLGHVTGRSPVFDSGDAGIAEALIGVVLAIGVVVMRGVPRLARTAGLASTGFATVGFLVGISITASAGHWPDIAYHATVLPILLGSLVVLLRARPATGAAK
jgi:hypothetical protein